MLTKNFTVFPIKSGENNLAVLEVASKADLGVACKHICSDLLETRDKLIEQNFVSGFITNPKGLVSNFLLKQRMQGQRPGPFAIEIPNNGRSTVGDTGLPFVLLATYKQPENGHFVEGRSTTNDGGPIEGVSTTNDGKPIICMMGVDGSKHTVYYDGELATYGADGEPIVRSYYLLKNGAIRELEKKLALQTIELAQLQAQYNTQKIENNKIKFAMREAMGQIDILQ